MHRLPSCSVRTVAVTRRWKVPDQNCTHKPRDSECLAVSFKMRSCQLTHSMRPWMRPVSLVTRQNCSLGMAVAGCQLAGFPCGRRLSRKCHPWLTCRDSKDRKRKREMKSFQQHTRYPCLQPESRQQGPTKRRHACCLVIHGAGEGVVTTKSRWTLHRRQPASRHGVDIVPSFMSISTSLAQTFYCYGTGPGC